MKDAVAATFAALGQPGWLPTLTCGAKGATHGAADFRRHAQCGAAAAQRGDGVKKCSRPCPIRPPTCAAPPLRPAPAAAASTAPAQRLCCLPTGSARAGQAISNGVGEARVHATKRYWTRTKLSAFSYPPSPVPMPALSYTMTTASTCSPSCSCSSLVLSPSLVHC